MVFLNRTSKQSGDAAEDAALIFLQQQGLRLLQRNYRTPGRGGGEIDLILQESDSTVVFVEVRKRALAQFGGALGSVVPSNSGALFLQLGFSSCAGDLSRQRVLTSSLGSQKA